MIETLFLGSIGVLAETSDIQRRAYNAAMAEVGLDWHWDEVTYRQLLGIVGGQDRLRLLADATGTELDDDTIARIHARKTEIACAEVASMPSPLRPGVAALIAEALRRDITLGLVTTTNRANIDAIAAAAGDDLPLNRFAVVVTLDDVGLGKPAPDAYRVALDRTGAHPASTLAIEDTAASVLSAAGAGVPVIAIPGEFSDGQVVVGADAVLPALADANGLHQAIRERLG